MFGITKKSDYGLELMIALAKNYQQGALSLKEIARKNKLPLKYLEQVAMGLRQAGLIEAKEGRGGGYSLSTSPKRISVAEVVGALEGPVEVGSCFGCPKAMFCGQKDIWSEVGEKVKKAIEGKTLADLLHRPQVRLPLAGGGGRRPDQSGVGRPRKKRPPAQGLAESSLRSKSKGRKK